MGVKLKIKIHDIPELRKELIDMYESKSNIAATKYSILLAKHIMDLTNFKLNEVIKCGFEVNKKWQNNQASKHDVRQAGFKLHELARNSQDIITQTIYRIIGHAVSSAHLKEHAVVASDYAVKLINLLHIDDESAVKQEREFQILLLEKIL